VCRVGLNMLTTIVTGTICIISLLTSLSICVYCLFLTPRSLTFVGISEFSSASLLYSHEETKFSFPFFPSSLFDLYGNPLLSNSQHLSCLGFFVYFSNFQHFACLVWIFLLPGKAYWNGDNFSCFRVRIFLPTSFARFWNHTLYHLNWRYY